MSNLYNPDFVQWNSTQIDRLIIYSSAGEDGKLEENLINSISADTLPPCLITRIDAIVGK